MPSTPVAQTNLDGLELKARGKVRDIYDLGEHLLIVATDRVSAFDFVLDQPIPSKGQVLTQISMFWFERLGHLAPHHVETVDVDEMPAAVRKHRDVLAGRTMLCKKAEPFMAECVVRGYLTGSGWKDYQATGAVCGIELPKNLAKNARIDPPIFTPATKADVGLHDENIDYAAFAAIVGDDDAARLKHLTLKSYKTTSEHAESRGITICDTKLEFGMINGEIHFIDEVFTPDSSRFWRTSELEATPAGGNPPSFDKQVVRDWLETQDWDKESTPPALPQEIIDLATERYLEIFEVLTGKPLASF